MRAQPILLEVIATTAADAKAAERAGADRLELVTAMGEGGLTPSVGLIEAVVGAVTIPVNVIVRPHSRSFVFDADDFAAMARDVRAAAMAGANGVVTGMLTASGEIDREGLRRLSDIASEAGVAVTFHRAFDETRDLAEAFDVLLGFDAVTTVLTSGGKPSALDARETVAELVRRSRGTRCTVLAGAGLTIGAVAGFVRDTGVDAVHFGSGVRIGGSGLGAVDEARVVQVRAALDAVTGVQT
ncbi:copper homeostasis protein CutC [Trinickia terrae]|uniref:PF03932 family protein CutC n=1 Tax=Trinickia terrae TaxID=2571161 RepID=A0A4V5PJQ6_9BURK|nr:copper homeostasis protein CutC [Trinickia terrae]TKC89380.1 copper homeostasis protein CutC [Trinickia terrae]